MVQVIFLSGPGWVTPQPPHLIGVVGFSGLITGPVYPNSGFSGISGYLRQSAGNPDLGEHETRADAFREVRECEA